MTIRALKPHESREIALVAQRMKATLVEVLGAERGASMYSDDWLVARVRFHLQNDRSVFLACDAAGRSVGHTIVRVEPDPEPHGLFSTTYVEREARRSGVARALLERGEAWMRERALSEAATYTDVHNAKLIALYRGRGYALIEMTESMVRLWKAL